MPVAVSMVQQPPLPEAKLALPACHRQDTAPLAKRQIAPQHVLIRNNGARHLWSTRLCAGANAMPVPTARQTEGVFSAAESPQLPMF
jgi:hypothetical protein